MNDGRVVVISRSTYEKLMSVLEELRPLQDFNASLTGPVYPGLTPSPGPATKESLYFDDPGEEPDDDDSGLDGTDWDPYPLDKPAETFEEYYIRRVKEAFPKAAPATLETAQTVRALTGDSFQIIEDLIFFYERKVLPQKDASFSGHGRGLLNCITTRKGGWAELKGEIESLRKTHPTAEQANVARDLANQRLIANPPEPPKPDIDKAMALAKKLGVERVKLVGT